MADTRSAVRSIVVRMAPEPAGAHDGDLRLVEDLGYDSLALLELAFAVEEHFGLRPIDLASASAIHSSGDLEEYVRRELA